jgi:predicted transport protein
VCIAGDFSRHDRVAVYGNRRRMDLVRYRVFEGGLLSLMLIESSPGSAGPGPTRRGGRERRAATLAGDGLRAAPTSVPECLRTLYGELEEALTAWGEVEMVHLRHYIAYRRMVNRASVLFRPSYGVILVYLALAPDAVVLEEGFTRDMRGIGHLGTGDLEVRIASAADLEKAGPLIRRAFEPA